MFAAVRHQAPMNQGKANDLAPLFDAYRAVLPAVIATMRTDLLRGNPVSSWPTVKPADFASPLSGRHFKSVWNMAYAAFDAWRATLKDTVRATITGSSLDEDTRTVLYRVNRAGAWHVPGLHLDWQVTDTGELVVPPPKNKRKEFERPRSCPCPWTRKPCSWPDTSWRTPAPATRSRTCPGSTPSNSTPRSLPSITAPAPCSRVGARLDPARRETRVGAPDPQPAPGHLAGPAGRSPGR